MSMKKNAFALALVLASLILISGCTSNKYSPCCAKDSIYDESGAYMPGAKCIFQNGSEFGSGGLCTVDATMSGAASCSDGVKTCASLLLKDDCEKTVNCLWDDALSTKCSRNDSITCQPGKACWMMAVCTDRVPKSCVNDRCMAMMCGYTSIKPAPPPTSTDWDPDKTKSEFENAASKSGSSAVPANDMITPAIGLQGVTCDFNTMNAKLFNKVKASRGSLWVNSFRFGVGNSFSDFEAAKYFFPASDRICAANPTAKIDRFTTYLGTKDTYCQGVTSYYTCKKYNIAQLGGLAFADEKNCQLYCGGGEPPYSCASTSGAERFLCNQDRFVYETKDICKEKCSIISDQNACTNNETMFPFLNTDGSEKARYRMKYVADYMVDTDSSATNSPAPCTMYKGPTGSYSFDGWSVPPEKPIACDDFAHDWPPPYKWTDGPWFWTYPDSGTFNNPAVLGELRTYFDNHAYSAVDFDYDYYKKELLEQYTEFDQNGRLPFECASSSDCLSGSCDTTYYKRGMCINKNNNDLPMSCYCSAKKFGTSYTPYPSCWLGEDQQDKTIYSNTEHYINGGGTEGPVRFEAGVLNNAGALFEKEDSIRDSNGEPMWYKYYAPAYDKNGILLDKPYPFELCQVPPSVQPVKKCILRDMYWSPETSELEYLNDFNVIFDPDPDGTCKFSAGYDEVCIAKVSEINGNGCGGWWNCGYIGCAYGSINAEPVLPLWYYEYSFNLSDSNIYAAVNAEHFGICKMNGNITNGITAVKPSPPYLKLQDLGWCAGCTYATLAVQTVEWGAETPGNPGGVGNPRVLSCYEYRGDFNYVPDTSSYPYGGQVGEASYSAVDGIVRWGGIATPSTQIVRWDSNPSSYEYNVNGNLEQGETYDAKYHYKCTDKWHANDGWWKQAEIPTPSAPYLKEKLTSYLQSSVMPILDEVDEATFVDPGVCSKGGKGWQCPDNYAMYSNDFSGKTLCNLACEAECTQVDYTGGYVCTVLPTTPYATISACQTNCFRMSDINKGYNPLSICNTFGGDGGVLHVVGGTDMLVATPYGNYGQAVPGSLSSGLVSYLWPNGAPPATQPVIFSANSDTDGKKAILARTDFLKQMCKTPPLVGIELLPDETLSSLIGTPAAPGKLHKFFYDEGLLPNGYDARVARGTPDKQADNVDILMHDWYPMCNGPGTLPGEKEAFEVEARMNFSRALMANFSKPSLIWKFAFPKNSNCNKTFFLDYLFQNVANMVDVGITGIIYSDWTTNEGLGYGPTSRTYNELNSDGDPIVLQTGLSQFEPTVRGKYSTNDITYGLDDMVTGKDEVFCALQRYSKRSIGYIHLTYGQKIYAENKTCDCVPCNSFDYTTGSCSLQALIDKDPSKPDLAQRYCNDATLCSMPADDQASYWLYKCEPRCLNETACKLCNSIEHFTDSSFCRITQAESSTMGYSWPYKNITDDYWEFLTGLSANEKCCLETTGTSSGGASKYTYVSMEGSKQQSEFLQFPKRGEFDLDCGRAPDTSVLAYCNLRVPISQKEIACVKIDSPPQPLVIGQDGTGID